MRWSGRTRKGPGGIENELVRQGLSERVLQRCRIKRIFMMPPATSWACQTIYLFQGAARMAGLCSLAGCPPTRWPLAHLAARWPWPAPLLPPSAARLQVAKRASGDRSSGRGATPSNHFTINPAHSGAREAAALPSSLARSAAGWAFAGSAVPPDERASKSLTSVSASVRDAEPTPTSSVSKEETSGAQTSSVPYRTDIVIRCALRSFGSDEPQRAQDCTSR